MAACVLFSMCTCDPFVMTDSLVLLCGLNPLSAALMVLLFIFKYCRRQFRQSKNKQLISQLALPDIYFMHRCVHCRALYYNVCLGINVRGNMESVLQLLLMIWPDGEFM